MNQAIDVSSEAQQPAPFHSNEAEAGAPIQQSQEKLSGHPTIGSKRVQADVLINYLAAGRTIHDFLTDYDAVTESEALAVLGVIKQAILDGMLTGVRLRDEDSC
ncbi:MAG: DUF433 domain-containing protein [Blastocatellales bacterium]